MCLRLRSLFRNCRKQQHALLSHVPTTQPSNTLTSNLPLFKSSVSDYWNLTFEKPELMTDLPTCASKRNYFTNSKNKIRKDMILSYPSLCCKLITQTLINKCRWCCITFGMEADYAQNHAQKWLDESQMLSLNLKELMADHIFCKLRITWKGIWQK